MRTELPLPSDLLEELGASVIGEIDNLAVTSFDSALDEMIRYHRFLLDAYASKDENGIPFSYSEVEATWFGKPHQDWIRQYHRIFERAVDRLREETDFVNTLAHLPIRLLADRVNNFSPAIISAILDLGPMLVSRLENWRTKHIAVGAGLDDSPVRRSSLSGSDKIAFSDVLRELTGAWETTLQLVGALYGWTTAPGRPDGEKWHSYVASWPFLKSHLHDTAYFVALAVWNEDDLGGENFTDALVHWSRGYEFMLPDRNYSPRDYVISPDLV